MKPTFQSCRLLPVLAAGLLLIPITTVAQEAGVEPARKDLQREVPGPDQIQAMVRELQDLHRAGKREEARPLAQRLRTLAKENPQLAESIHNALKSHAPSTVERPGTPGPGQPPAQPAPAGPGQAQPPRHMPGGQGAPPAQPNMTGPGCPLTQPNTGGRGCPPPQPNMTGPGQPQAQPPLRPHMPGGQAQPMVQPNMACQGCPLARNRSLGWQGGSMLRSHRHGGWGPRMEQSNGMGQQRRMAWQKSFGWQGGPMARSHRHGGWGPRMEQPNGMGQHRQMARPNTAEAQRPMVRPNMPEGQAKPLVQAEQAQVARIRHLRQAAGHLAAAGFVEQAAKAREESGRMEAEMHQRKAQAPADMAAPREAPRRAANQQNRQPEAGRAPDPNAAMLGEMRKLSKQIEQLSARMQKLESRAAE